MQALNKFGNILLALYKENPRFEIWYIQTLNPQQNPNCNK